ncbi:MAG: hypothetical protein J7K54_03390 [Candidatus Aenigmarchaeota archaeon]|nr:hypothetical protein [Candidatus Aenigmarchaeota archaeon]
METRKIQSVGNRSFSVCLPKSWVTENNLSQHDTVFIERGKRNEIILRSGEPPAKRPSSLTASLREIDDVTEFLVFCYVRNIDNVTLSTTGSPYEKVAQVKKTLKYLDGYDITAEDENRLVISFLFRDVNINLGNIEQRMMYLLRHMAESLQRKDKETVEDIETNIDRLYHLSKRILFSCLGNAEIMKLNDVNSEGDLFFLNLIFKKIENIGDNMHTMINFGTRPRHVRSILTLIELISGFFTRKRGSLEVKNGIRNIMKMYSEDRDRAGIAVHKIAELCMDITENTISMRFDTKYCKEF